MKNKILFWSCISLGLLGVCLFAILPLFHAGIFTMHDDEQVGRLQQMFLILSQGQFPPRWIPDLGFGFGYPLFNFYPPLVYYVGSLIHLVGFSFINSTKIVFGLGFFLSALTMFIWARKHYGTIAGLFAAILYTYAPYHSVDGYVRGALSEFFSWIFIPLILWAIDMLFEKRQKKYIVIVGISFGLLMLSHTLVMLQFGPILLLYLIFLFLFRKNRNFTAWIYLALGVGLGLGLTAYFWLPSILEKQYTLVDAILTKELASYSLHFVCPVELWSGIWGYGGSAAGCVDGISFQLGKVQAVMGILGLLLSTFYVFKKRYLVSFGVGVLFLCSIFLTLSYSKFLWDIAKPFWYIQFPWRYLLFAAVFSSFLGGFILSLVQNKFGKPIAIILGIMLSLIAVVQVRNYFRPQAYRMVTDTDMTSQETLQWYVSGLSYEYVPKEVATRLSQEKTTELAINKSDLPKQSYLVLSGSARVIEKKNISTLKEYEVDVLDTKENILFQINTFNFPVWIVLVDGKQGHIVKNRLDLLQIFLPSGKHQVMVKFVDTPVRAIANNISLAIGVLLVIGIVLVKRKKL